jgi:lipopolysaccharide transport system ATP-binding protein
MIVIEVDNVSKRYRLGSAGRGLRSALAAMPGTLLRRGSGPRSEAPDLWALKNVSLDVRQGEALGIIGHNGAGKTTILKLLSGITQPTTGRVTVTGRIAALVELGAGFHPDLTGRENVYLYGTILGLSRREISGKLKSIVDFAELHAFLDTPVKRYSSGMYARLAFAVAAHVDPDILLVDEVLSVGDSAFQQKCLDFLHDFVRSGKTTVFISHSTWAIEQLCSRIVWLDHGMVRQEGDPSAVLEQYLESVEQRPATVELDDGNDNDPLKITQVHLTDASGVERQTHAPGDDLVVSIDYWSEDPLPRPHFCIWVSDTIAPHPLFSANMIIDGNVPDSIVGHGTIQCIFKNLPLMPRTYFVWVEVYGADCAEILLTWRRVASFRIADPVLMRQILGRKGAVRFVKSHSAVRVDYEWADRGDHAAHQEMSEVKESAGAKFRPPVVVG